MKNLKRDFSIKFCYRSIAIDRGELHPTALSLQKLGYHVSQIQDSLFDFKPNEIVWIQENANFFPKIIRKLLAIPKNERPFVVVWHTEPLLNPKAAGFPWPLLHVKEIAKIILRDKRATDVYTNFFVLRRIAMRGLPNLLIASSLGRYEFLMEHNIDAHFVPFGYYHAHGNYMGLKRDIDVFFLGTLDIPRRRRNIKRLRRNGIDILKMGSWSDPACYGENRTRLLNRTKIFLNIQRYPGLLSGVRLILGMANKALVISEPMYRSDPYISGRHYISATIDEMPRIINYYLTHNEEYKQIVNEGYRLVTERVTMDQSVSHIIKLINMHINQ